MKIAIAKRAQEIHDEKKREDDNRKNREQLEREAEVVRRQERDSKYPTSSSSRCLFSLRPRAPSPCTVSTYRSSLRQMMTTTIAAARGASAGGDLAEEITETGVQMMTDVQGITMSRLDPVQSGPKLLPILPHRHRGDPSPFLRPTRQLLDQRAPSPPQ